MRIAIVIENIFTVATAGATMVGLYAFGAGFLSLAALVLLLNLNNYPVSLK